MNAHTGATGEGRGCRRQSLKDQDGRRSSGSAVRLTKISNSASDRSVRSWRRVTRPPALVRSRCGEPEGDRSKQTPCATGMGSSPASYRASLNIVEVCGVQVVGRCDNRVVARIHGTRSAGLLHSLIPTGYLGAQPALPAVQTPGSRSSCCRNLQELEQPAHYGWPCPLAGPAFGSR